MWESKKMFACDHEKERCSFYTVMIAKFLPLWQRLFQRGSVKLSWIWWWTLRMYYYPIHSAIRLTLYQNGEGMILTLVFVPVISFRTSSTSLQWKYLWALLYMGSIFTYGILTRSFLFSQWKAFLFNIYTFRNLNVTSILTGSLPLANEYYSLDLHWSTAYRMRDPNKSKLAGLNSRFASESES